ncbi:MAG: aldo/keto reductase [Chitinivibrionales bacterium]|nr:aldo/keto reductase [Chitinivibrionales bacterium]
MEIALDLFYQHRIDSAFSITDVAGEIKVLVQEGKVKQFGICEKVRGLDVASILFSKLQLQLDANIHCDRKK